MSKYIVVKLLITFLCLSLLVSCTKKSEGSSAGEALTSTTEALAGTTETGGAGTLSETESIPETEQKPEEIDLEKIRQESGLSVQYIRTNEMNGGFDTYPSVVVLRSKEECNRYYQENRIYADLESREIKYIGGTIGFLNACQRYDDMFWENNDLLLVRCWEASGSYRHVVTGIEEMSEGVWEISVQRIRPYGETTDVAVWHLLVEIPKGECGADDKFVVNIEKVEVKTILYPSESSEN